MKRSTKILRLTLALLAGVSLLVFGCTKKETPRAVMQESLAVSQIDLPELKKKLQRNDGKLTVVNFWATWCDPCKEEMPYLVRLRNEYRDSLELLLVGIDDVALIDSVMKPILKNAGVNFSCYIKQEGNDEDFINGINPEWSGALPATFIYNAKGEQMDMLISEQTFEKFQQAVRACLRK